MARVPDVNDRRAHALLEASFDGTYRFPVGFNGFSGVIAVAESMPGGTQRTDHGKVRVAGSGDTTIEGVVSADLEQWALKEMRSIAGHRWPMTYQDADGKHTLALDDESRSLLGTYIKVIDDRFDSAYRLKNGRISQVIRTMGATTFTITIQADMHAADGRRLPSHFTVHYWKDGRLARSDMYEDHYVEHDGVWLPVARQVTSAEDGGFTVRWLEIGEIALLEEPVEAAVPAAERSGTRAG